MLVALQTRSVGHADLAQKNRCYNPGSPIRLNEVAGERPIA